MIHLCVYFKQRQRIDHHKKNKIIKKALKLFGSSLIL